METVIFENEEIIVFNKECGKAVQSELEDIVKEYKDTKGIDLHPITRLDQPVSGLALFAKSSSAANKYTELLKGQNIEKKYVAIVEGKFPLDIPTLDNRLSKKGNKAIEDNIQGKRSILNIEKIEYLDRYSRILLNIETGRFHQIRAQLSLAGHPVKGDLKYGSKRSNKEGGIYLHCISMSINDEIQLIADFPKDKNLYTVSDTITE
jgi:23S rRNA pseudouridine1911/1915/1917 synthase